MTERDVMAAQNVSRMCFVCGVENDAGLHARFLELGSGELLGTFVPREHHQGYPGRMHGGVLSTILDETMGRALGIGDPEVFGVTLELNVRFKKPVPTDREVRAIGRITNDNGRIFEAAGEIVLADGTVAVEATGRYMRLPIERIAEGDFIEEWFPDAREIPATVEL